MFNKNKQNARNIDKNFNNKTQGHDVFMGEFLFGIFVTSNIFYSQKKKKNIVTRRNKRKNKKKWERTFLSIYHRFPTRRIVFCLLAFLCLKENDSPWEIEPEVVHYFTLVCIPRGADCNTAVKVVETVFSLESVEKKILSIFFPSRFYLNFSFFFSETFFQLGTERTIKKIIKKKFKHRSVKAPEI